MTFGANYRTLSTAIAVANIIAYSVTAGRRHGIAVGGITAFEPVTTTKNPPS